MNTSNPNALTLTELLISIVLIGIVSVGVISTNYATHKIRDEASSTSLLYLNTRATIDRILKDGELAVGQPASTNCPTGILCPPGIPGVLIGSDIGGNSSDFCIRQIANFSASINDLSNSKWVCYTLSNDPSIASPPYPSLLYTCAKNFDSTAEPWGAGMCQSSDIGYALVGKAASITPVFDSSNFTITFVNRDVPTSPKSSSNPEVSLTFSVTPGAHSQ